jgi:hypothetical protein
VAEFGDRVLWGLDWPHPNFDGPIPDDGVLVDLVSEIAPDDKQRQALLVDNLRVFMALNKKAPLSETWLLISRLNYLKTVKLRLSSQ